MKRWEQFEIDCVDYLTKTYGNKFYFEHKGFSNSMVSDIKVYKDNIESFFIESKLLPSQCCQFVLFPDENKFKYSKNNKNNINQYSENIISYMNDNFDYYSNKNIKRKPIIYNNCKNDFFNCIKEFYKNKNVKYFIINGFKIISINDIDKIFDITAEYRIKKSGSNKVSKFLINEIINYIKINYKNILEYNFDGEYINIITSENLDKQKFRYNDLEFIFSKTKNGYKIRQLSNTYHSNVIFSIKLLTNFDIKFVTDIE